MAFDPAAYLKSVGVEPDVQKDASNESATVASGFDPAAYLRSVDSQQASSAFDPAAYLRSVSEPTETVAPATQPAQIVPATQPSQISPETGFSSFIPAVKRGTLGLVSLGGDVLPAMAGRVGEKLGIQGAKEYADRQMAEAAQSQKEIEQNYPSAVPSYTNIKGAGDLLTYIVEAVGESIPSLLPSIFTGGAAGIIGRGATIAAKQAAEKAVIAAAAEGVTGAELQSLAMKAGADAARKTALKYEAAGALAGSAVQNIPDVYQSIAQSTGKEALGATLVAGGFNTVLDAITPLNLMRIARKRGFTPDELIGGWVKRLGKGFAEGLITEGGTEAVQEMSTAAAEKFVDQNKNFFTRDNFVRFLDSGLKGGLGGGAITGATNVAFNRATPKASPLEQLIKDESVRAAEPAIAPTPTEQFAPVSASQDTAAMLAETEGKPLVKAPEEIPSTPMVIPSLQTIEAPVADLKISKDVPQFKYGAEASTGVVEPLGGKFERTGVAPIQLWERNNGDLEVISGRHRLDLAKRSGEATIPAQVHKESEGFDVTQAASLDALLNIREGQGKVKDYVTYFQRPGYTREEAESSGVLARSTGQRAYSIATNGSSDLIAAHRADVLTDEAATRIANSAPKEDSVQALGMKLIQEGKSINNAVNMMQAVKAISGGRGEATTDMFGFDDSAMREAEEMAKIASKKQADISQDLSAVTGASKRPEVAKKYGVDVRDPASLQAKIDELRQQKMAWENWSSNPALVTQIQNQIRGVESEIEVAPEVDTSTPSMFESRGTVEQDNAAESVLERHKNSFKGASIVYRNGDLTLIKTMNPRTGGIIYTPAKGTSYPSFLYDITSDEGRKQLTALGLTVPEKRELVFALQDLEAAEQAKHEKTPYLKIKPGINASDAIPKNMLGVIKGWNKLLNLKGNIYITTVEDAVANKDKYTGPHRTIGNLGIRGGTGVTTKLKDGTSVIVFEKSSSLTKMLEIVAHEMGHIHEKEVFNNAPPETQAAIKKAYDEWRSGITPKTPATELVNKLRAKTTAQTTTMPAGVLVEKVKDVGYWTGFNEWYADQVARWSVSSEKPITVVDKFFAKLATALRRFYNTVKGQNYLPNETFKQYLDTVASKAQIDSLIEEKAPKGQMALFSKGEVETKTNTPAFKRWFGNSKVVDENGQPLVLYHGTYDNFPIFQTEFGNDEYYKFGIHVGNAEQASKRIEDLNNPGNFSRIVDKSPSIMPLYIQANNPLRLDENRSGRWGVNDILREMMEKADKGELKSISKNHVNDYFNDEFNMDKAIGKKSNRLWANDYEWQDNEKTEALKSYLKKLGYDSIVYKNNFEGGGDSYILLNSNQVKSAIGNTGAYSLTEDEMHLSRSEIEAEGPKGIEKLSRVRRNYRNQIVSPTDVFSIPDDSKMERFIYKIQDKYIDTKRVIQAIISQGKEITDKWNAYLKEELYHGRTAKRTKDFLNNELLPIVRSMLKQGISIVEFDTYLQARHAEERNKQIAKINPEFLEDGTLNPNAMPDGGSGMFTKEAQDYLNNLPPEKAKALEEIAKKIDAIVKGTQQVLIDAGLESQATIDVWNKTYEKYVPLMRKDLDFAQDYTGLGQGFQTRGSASKRAFGSFKEVADIFANIANQRERAIVRAEKARVGTALYGLAIMNPNPDFWLPVNPDAIKNEKALFAELRKLGISEADAANIIQEPQTAVLDPDTGTVTYKVNPILRNSPNVFAIRINGQERFIFFNASDPRAMRMVQAIKNLDAEEMGWALGNAAKVTRWIASVNTQYNPVFGAYNFIRDTLGAQFNLSTTAIAGKQAQVTAGVFPALKGIYSDLRTARAGKGVAKGEWAKLWEEYQQEGGATGYRDQFSKNRSDQNVIEKEIRNLEKGNIKKGVAAVFNWLSDYNDAMENAVRLSAYKVAIDQGISKEQAASIAKNLTVNFNRKGERAQQLGSLYAFYNASVQGTARLAETLRGPAGKKIVAGGLLLGSVQALALAMMGFKDDEPPEFIKARNLVIPFPDGHYIAIPMPLGLHIIPNMGRITTEMVMNGGKDAGKKVTNLAGVLMDAFNPIGNAGLSMQSLSPTMLDPIAAIIENKDTFGRPIAKEDRATNPTPGYTRARETASYLGKELSYFLNLASGGTKYQKGLVSPTPDQIDFLFGQATGGIGREISKVEQTVTAAVTGEELPTYKVPLVGKFYGDVLSQAAQANRFYDNITRMANYENEIKGRRKDNVATADFFRDHPEAKLWQQANRLENQISTINREKKDLLEKNAPAARIKQLDERKTRIMTQFNNQVESLEK